MLREVPDVLFVAEWVRFENVATRGIRIASTFKAVIEEALIDSQPDFRCPLLWLSSVLLEPSDVLAHV